MFCSTVCVYGLVGIPQDLYSPTSALLMSSIRFPFLFYSTTYVGQIMAYEHNEEPDKDIATRTGEFAMLIYSIGKYSLEFNIFLPEHDFHQLPLLLDLCFLTWPDEIGVCWLSTMKMKMLSLFAFKIQSVNGGLKLQDAESPFAYPPCL